MQDKQGRPYLKCEGLKANTVVEVDGDFTCIAKGSHVVIFDAVDGFYFHCAEGTHYLDGQISEDETHYVGLYNVG